MLEIETIESPEALAALAPEWNALLARMSLRTPSKSPLWQLTWWRHFGSRRSVAAPSRHARDHAARRRRRAGRGRADDADAPPGLRSGFGARIAIFWRGPLSHAIARARSASATACPRSAGRSRPLSGRARSMISCNGAALRRASARSNRACASPTSKTSIPASTCARAGTPSTPPCRKRRASICARAGTICTRPGSRSNFAWRPRPRKRGEGLKAFYDLHARRAALTDVASHPDVFAAQSAQRLSR